MVTRTDIYGYRSSFTNLDISRPPLRPQQEELDDKSRGQWERLGLSLDIANRFPDCVKFLLDSKLIYTIIGFGETCQDDTLHGLRISEDDDAHPLIKVQGEWMRWDQLKRLIVYDPEEDQIKSAGYEGSIVQIWNYFHPHGLVRQDRFYYSRPFPVFQLLPEEMNQLKIQARRFYETNPEIELGVEKDCVLQFFTSPRREGILENPLLENFARQYPMHISIRLVTGNGNVYSFGYQLPIDQQKQIAENITSTLLKTGDARIAMLDYEEFRKHKGRYVTSIPVTSKNAEDILSRIAELNERQLRFNYGRQNCSSLVKEVTPPEYHVDLHTTAKQALWETVPSLSQLPYIGYLIGAVQNVIERIWNTILDYTPECIQSLFSWADYIVFALPRTCQTVASNLFLWKIGADTMTRPLDPGVEEDFSIPTGKIQSFSTLFRSWTDFFKDQDVFQPAYFIQWQKEQNSTSFHAARDRPRLEGLLDFPPMPVE